MNKLARMYRRFRLGKRYKHQYRCHADFSLIRHKDNLDVVWKNEIIATVPHASTLKNKFSNSCFTVATGPSLKDVDLTLSSQHDSISLNCAIKKFKEKQLAPTHCLIIDRAVFENDWQCIKDSVLSGANCFFSYVGLSRICEREPELFKKGNIYLIEGIGRQFGIARPSREEFREKYDGDDDIFVDTSFPQDRGAMGFSCDLEKGVFTGKTVATWAVQLAYYLGYKNNFIAGMDLGGTGQSYFYNNGKNNPPNFLANYEPVIRVSFEQTRRASEQRGFSVYNLSEHSSLPDKIIPKISYAEAIVLADNYVDSK